MFTCMCTSVLLQHFLGMQFSRKYLLIFLGIITVAVVSVATVFHYSSNNITQTPGSCAGIERVVYVDVCAHVGYYRRHPPSHALTYIHIDIFTNL